MVAIRTALAMAAAMLLALAPCSHLVAKPQTLADKPIDSPTGEFWVNLEWEDVGFIGILRMKVFGRSGELLRTIEVPEISPDPANLSWIDNEWVGCESYLGTNGSGFFYVHAPSGRGYLVEIVASRPREDWVFSVATSDPLSSAAISTISRGRSSLFPILLRNAPENEAEYFMPDFCRQLSVAADAYNDFRRRNHIVEIEFLSDADIRSDLGAVCVASVDDHMEVLYFPAGAPTPQDMLSRAKRQRLPSSVGQLLDAPNAPEPTVRWLQGGEYVVEGAPADGNPTTTSPATMVLARGKFEGVTDVPMPTPTPPPAAKEKSEKGKKSKKIVPDDEDESGKPGATVSITDSGTTAGAKARPPARPAPKSRGKRSSR
jgi:hypothetical protein